MQILLGGFTMSDDMKYLYVENNIDEGMDNCFNCASEMVEEHLVEDSDIEEHKSTVISCIECGALWNNITRRVINERHRIDKKLYAEVVKIVGVETAVQIYRKLIREGSE
jgi:hypothetical protein